MSTFFRKKATPKKCKCGNNLYWKGYYHGDIKDKRTPLWCTNCGAKIR